jgi:DNA-binding LytR/AlgR family response regulator
VLSGSVHRHPRLELVGVAATIGTALSLISEQRPDLVLLDIGLADQSGFDLLAMLPEAPLVVVTTGAAAHALQAFDSGVQDMLVKPFTYERFNLAIERCLAAAKEYRPSPGHTPVADATDHLTLAQGKRLVRIPHREIRHVEAHGNHVLVHLSDRTLRFACTLKHVEGLLPSSGFVRVHRCHIVSRSAVLHWNGAGVHTAVGLLPVGASYRAGLLEFMLASQAHLP